MINLRVVNHSGVVSGNGLMVVHPQYGFSERYETIEIPLPRAAFLLLSLTKALRMLGVLG